MSFSNQGTFSSEAIREVGLKKECIRMNRNNLLNFINFKYAPFSKSQCIKRIVLLWILNIPFYFICRIDGFDKFSFYIGIAFTSINLIVLFVFVYLICKKSNTKEARFLCDGITYLYYSVLLNMLAFILLSYNKKYSFLLILFLIAVLLSSVAMFMIIVYKSIKRDDYAEGNTAAGKYTFIPFSSGILGTIFARILFNNVDDTQIGIYVIGLCSLFFSCIMSIGSISFVRLFVLKKLKADKSENSYDCK